MSTEQHTDADWEEFPETPAPKEPSPITSLSEVAALIHYPQHWDTAVHTNLAAAAHHAITTGIICPQCNTVGGN